MNEIGRFFCAIFNHHSSIQLIGVFLDITGAFYLSRSFIFKSPLAIKFDTYGTGNSKLHTSFGMSGNLFMSFYTQGMEARIGFVFLLGGFLFQAVGLVWLTFTFPIYLTLIVWVLTTVFAYMLRRHLNDFERVKKIHDRNEQLSHFKNNPKSPIY